MMRQYELVERVQKYKPDANEALLNKAYVYAMQKHGKQTRASGDPYFSHPLEVAAILTDLHLDEATIAVALLHDTIEDTTATRDEIDELFGEEIGRLVEGLTKIKKLDLVSKKAKQAENLRKLLLAISDDLRVLLVKLADRLHNMRTLGVMRDDKRRRISEETMDIYAPLAGRMGMQEMRDELEELAFRNLNPEAWETVTRRLAELSVQNEGIIDKIETELRDLLASGGLKDAVVKGRQKKAYSVFRKMQSKSLSFEQLSDVFAFRIITNGVPACYQALGLVHERWRVVPGRFKDYISTPKQNGYRSIHTTIVGPARQRIELQIRTQWMHEVAELGIAAHSLYKDGQNADGHQAREVSAYSWLRQTIEALAEGDNPEEFLEHTKLELFQDQVFCFSPKGKLIALPRGATPIDFAYAVHTDIGDTCVGAKINGRIVPLTYELKSGEQVEILTTRQGGPSRDWLNPHLGYLKTSRARAKVRTWFKQQDQGQNLVDGKSLLDRELQRLGVGSLDHEKLRNHFHMQNEEEMLIAIGRGDINPAQIASAVHRLTAPAKKAEAPTHHADHKRESRIAEGITIRGVGNLLTNLARCCKPAPGDPIIGFITQGRGVSIHRRDCKNVLNLPENKLQRLIDVEWGGFGEEKTYPVDVEIEAIDRQGLLIDIYTVLNNEKINMLSTNTLSDKRTNSARIEMTLEIADTSQLSRVLSRINQVHNVVSVKRKL